MKTISILGSGWLGLPLAEHLVQQEFAVKASTRSASRNSEIEAIDAIPFLLDIDDPFDDIKTFLESHILIVNITSKNIEAFTRLIAEIEKSSIEKVLFVSSTSIYRNTNSIITESDGAENDDSPLLKIENLLRASLKFQTTIVRFAGLIGYSRHPGRFFGEREIPQPDTPVNLIHRDDCIGILSQILEQDIWGEVFNACADTHPSKAEFYSYARQDLGRDSLICGQQGERNYKIISNEKVKRILSYEMRHQDLMNLSFEKI